MSSASRRRERPREAHWFVTPAPGKRSYVIMTDAKLIAFLKRRTGTCFVNYVKSASAKTTEE